MLVRMELCNPELCVGVDDGKFKLFLCGIEVNEEIVDLVQHLLDPCIMPVYLVNHKDRRKIKLEGLFQNESCLGQRALRGVHEKQHAINHLEGPFHLPAEIGMARCIHNIDLDPLVYDGRILCHDGNAPLTLQGNIVHHPLPDLLVQTENARLLEQAIDECCLSMINMGNKSNVPQILSFHQLIMK